MAVIGKKSYLVYLNSEDVETIRVYLSGKKHSGGLSALLDKYVSRCAAIIRQNPIRLGEIEGGKMTVKKFIQLAMLDVE